MKYEYTEDTIKIAKFMGIEPMKGISDGHEYYYYNNFEFQCYEALPWYNTWDELMPVIIKIESFGEKINLIGNSVLIGDKEFVAETKIDAVYKAIVWYISNNI